MYNVQFFLYIEHVYVKVYCILRCKNVRVDTPHNNQNSGRVKRGFFPDSPCNSVEEIIIAVNFRNSLGKRLGFLNF